MIDIGGPSMLRAAAKNFAHVAPVCRPRPVRERARASCASTGRSRPSAARARGRGVRDDGRVRGGDRALVRGRRGVSRSARARVRPRCSTSPTARTRTSARRTTPRPARAATCSRASSSSTGGSCRSTTSNDLSAARLLLREFALPACVIVKHANPCGVAVAATIEEAYDRALASDPVSAYGRVCALNRPVGGRARSALAEQFVEVLFAPGYEEAPSRRCSASRHADPPRPRAPRGDRGERDFKRVLGGLLVQDRDWDVEDREDMEVVCGDPTRPHGATCSSRGASASTSPRTRSCSRGTCQTIGIGAGQQSRVDAVRIALEKAREHGHDLAGSVLASDAFFPFADGTAAGARRRRDGDRPARAASEARRRGGRGGRARRARRWSFTGRRHLPARAPPASVAPRCSA